MANLFKFLGTVLSNAINIGSSNTVESGGNAIGSNLQVKSNQTVLGVHNQPLDSGYVFIVGAGSDGALKNILSLTKSGNLNIPGSIRPGSYSNLPVFVTDVTLTADSYTVVYSDGSTKSGEIGSSDTITTVYASNFSANTNSHTYYYMTFDAPLDSKHIYVVDEPAIGEIASMGGSNNATPNGNAYFSIKHVDTDGTYKTSVFYAHSNPTAFMDGQIQFMFVDGRISIL